jgi:hypothetical protein
MPVRLWQADQREYPAVETQVKCRAARMASATYHTMQSRFLDTWRHAAEPRGGPSQQRIEDIGTPRCARVTKRELIRAVGSINCRHLIVIADIDILRPGICPASKTRARSVSATLPSFHSVRPRPREVLHKWDEIEENKPIRAVVTISRRPRHEDPMALAVEPSQLLASLRGSL